MHQSRGEEKGADLHENFQQTKAGKAEGQTAGWRPHWQKHWLRVKGWKKIYHTNGPWKQAGVAIFISDKVDFKLTLIKWDKEGHPILIKRKITIIKLYAPNIGTPNFIKHTLRELKAYIDSNTVVVGDFNTPLSPIDRSTKQKNQ
jgi:hypothetical protein